MQLLSNPRTTLPRYRQIFYIFIIAFYGLGPLASKFRIDFLNSKSYTQVSIWTNKTSTYTCSSGENVELHSYSGGHSNRQFLCLVGRAVHDLDWRPRDRQLLAQYLSVILSR
jgi:hypothetical protein